MRLSDKDIHKYLKSGEFVAVGTNPKYPFDSIKQVQPCSIDLRLDNKFFKFREDILDFDLKNLGKIQDYIYVFEVADGEKITLQPHEILFGQIYEQLRIPSDCSGMVEGRSRFARLGLSIHATGGFINPEFEGAMPLQIINNNNIPITIYPYITVCQLLLIKLTTKPLIPYPMRSDNPYHKEIRAGHSNLHKDAALGMTDENLPNLNIEIERRLVSNYLKQMEMTELQRHLNSHASKKVTNIRIENSQIGLLNTGTIEKTKKITANVNSLNKKGNKDIAKSLDELTSAVIKSSSLKEEIKHEIIEQLEEISKQANLKEDKRSNKSTIRAILKSIGETLSATGGLAEIWTAWGKDITSFFGI